MVGEADEFQPLLDGATDAGAVGVDVAEQLGELARLEHEFAESFVAERGLGMAEVARKVGVQAYEGEVVGRGDDVAGAEVAGVVADHAAEVDLGKFGGGLGDSGMSVYKSNVDV